MGMLLGRHHWNTTSTVVKFILHAGVRERWHLGLLGLSHIFAHTYELLHQELKNRVLILSFKLGQLLQFSDLDHVWVLFHLLLFDHALLLGEEHLLVPNDLAILSFNELLVLDFLVLYGLFHNLKSLLSPSSACFSLNYRRFLQKGSFRDRCLLSLEDHGGWAVWLVEE